MLTVCGKSMHPTSHQIKDHPHPLLTWDTSTYIHTYVDILTMEASITAERKESLLQELLHLHLLHKCMKQQLLSLIGKLSFSCKVLPAGRIFYVAQVYRLEYHCKEIAPPHMYA